jgi:serine/threonine protein kinase
MISNEVVICDFLEQSAPLTYGIHVTKLLDFFHHKGPNGTHLCLVVEIMRPSADSMMENFSSHQYPTWMAKSILRQVLQGLMFLHDQGIIHGDVQPGNILFSVRSLTSCLVEELEQNTNTRDGISQPVERLDGKVDLWAPRYLVESRPLADYADIQSGFTVKLSDLGSCKFAIVLYHQPKIPTYAVPSSIKVVLTVISVFHCRSTEKSPYSV